nr:hypothetical protein [Tanacetum cinerariifolium]
LQAPPSPDYIPSPEELEQAPPLPDYIPGPEHADDEIVAKDQPYAEDASPIAQSPEYVPESDFEAHPEDDDDDDPEEDPEDPVDYPADGGDDGNDEEESSEDDKDDYMDVKADEEEEEEEEHQAPANSVVAPPSPDYIPGPEEPEQAPPSPGYIPGPKHADDEIVAEDQPYAEDASPISQSPEYVPESDFEAHPEDDDDEDPEEDPVDYLADGGDDGDDQEESSEDDEEEEEEHPAPADSVVVALKAADQALSVEETEPFETDESAATPPPHPAYRTVARIFILALVPMPAWTDSEVARLLAISSPPASPLSPWTSPPPQIPFPPLPPILLPPSPILALAPPPSPIRSLGYRAAMIRLRDEAASTSHSPPSQLLSASRREDRPEVTLPPRKRLDIALGP